MSTPTVFRSTAQGDLAEFKLSAAVLLTRAVLGSREPEIYLVERSPALRFFPGHWALAGGRLDPRDGEVRVGADAGSVDPSQQLVPFARCAARELFEETGVLLSGLELESVERPELRRGLLADHGRSEPAALDRWFELLDPQPSVLSALRPAFWTTTPDFTQRRYRALYLHLELPAGEEPTVIPGELSRGQWWRPSELIEAWRRGELRVVPPLVALAELLESCQGDLSAALEGAEALSRAVDEGALHVVSPAPGVHLAPVITETLPPARTTNCYVVGEASRYVVDPAPVLESERQRLLAHLESERGALRGVLVTHHHPDHTGAVQAVAEHFELPVFAHPRTLDRLPEAPTRPIPLEEGQRLDLGTAPDGSTDWQLEVLHTPGHARGHLCFRDSRYRTLIAGDLVATLSTILVDPPEGHLATYLAQLERVRELGVGVVLPSHGPAAPLGSELLDRFLRHRALREAVLIERLRELGPATVDELLPKVYDDVPEAAFPLARRNLVAGLDKLLEDERLVQGSEDPPRFGLVEG